MKPWITKAELEKIARRNRDLEQDPLFPGGGSDMSADETQPEDDREVGEQ